MTKSKYPKLRERVLRDRYEWYGHFYTLVLGDEKKIRCRSVLEIVSKPFKDDVQSLSLRQPNAVVVMMNPGSSEPNFDLIEDYEEATIRSKEFSINFKSKKLVPAIPDGTQYRIMNVMNVLGWKHVRIVNLSDIREVNSNLLNIHLRKFSYDSESDRHSIFSDLRKNERVDAFGWTQDVSPTRIIAGWGTLDCLREISAFAEEKIKNNIVGQLNGIQKRGTNYYYHPGRRKNWHDDIIDQIKLLTRR